MKIALFKTTSLLILLSVGSINKTNAITGTGSIISGGITRTFTYHAMGLTIPPNLPVMIVMHGDGGSGASVETQTGFDAVADANNFLAIYPDAVSGAWNRYVDTIPGDAGLGNLSAPDDVLFISDLIDYLCASYVINPNKVYASGHSAGGFMAYNLSIQLTDKIAAIGPVSADLWGDDPFMTDYFANHFVPIPICHIHGDADSYGGGGVDYPDADFTANFEWPISNFTPGTCGNVTYTATNAINAFAESNLFCDGLTTPFMEVELVRVFGMGHAWPNPANFDASTYIWNFCNQYSLTTGVTCHGIGIEENPLDKLSIYPVPVVDQLNIVGDLPTNLKVEIIDGLGKVVYSQKDFVQSNIQVSNLSTGIYFLSVRTDNYVKRIKFIKN